MACWDEGSAGVLRLPSGRRVRGRGLNRGRGSEQFAPRAELAVLLTLRRPPATAIEDRWIRWPDFGVPLHRDEARTALLDAWDRCSAERVEVACGGGVGRTGTALACLAVLDGLGPDEAIAHVRRHHHRRAVETPWQRQWVRRFAAAQL